MRCGGASPYVALGQADYQVLSLGEVIQAGGVGPGVGCLGLSVGGWGFEAKGFRVHGLGLSAEGFMAHD